MIELSSSQINYLKTIYLLSLKGKITITGIAQELKCSKPSVIKALKKLTTLNLIIYTSNNIKLTELGLKYANNIMRKDDVLKNFFIKVLEIDESIANVDAEKIKSVVSCYTINKLEQFMEQFLNEEEVVKYENYCLCNHNCNPCVNNKN